MNLTQNSLEYYNIRINSSKNLCFGVRVLITLPYIRISNCHDHHAVKNKIDTGHREHFQWAILRRCSQIFSLILDWRVFCTRLKISAYSRQRAYLRSNKKSLLRYFDLRSIIHAIRSFYIARKCHACLANQTHNQL